MRKLIKPRLFLHFSFFKFGVKVEYGYRKEKMKRLVEYDFKKEKIKRLEDILFEVALILYDLGHPNTLSLSVVQK